MKVNIKKATGSLLVGAALASTVSLAAVTPAEASVVKISEKSCSFRWERGTEFVKLRAKYLVNNRGDIVRYYYIYPVYRHGPVSNSVVIDIWRPNNHVVRWVRPSYAIKGGGPTSCYVIFK